jgi:hypothetical protein
MKKNYTVTLDDEKVDLIKPWLEKKGTSFSGFLNAAVDQMAEGIVKMDLPDDVSKMSIGNFMKAFSRLTKVMREKE